MINISMCSVKDFGAPKNQNFPVKKRFTSDELACFERDNFTCHYCGDTDGLTIDHVVPRSRGGQDCLNNYLTACHSCNASKRGKSYQDFLDWRELQLVTYVSMVTMADCL